MRRTKEDAEKTRQEILKYAAKVLNLKGYHATRLEDIAAAAGVTRGAIYHHFGSKIELIRGIVQENKSETNKILDEISAKSITPIQGLKEALITIIKRLESDAEFAEREQLLFQLDFYGDLTELETEFKENLREGFEKVIAALQESQDENLIRKELNLESVAFLFISTYLGIMSTYFLNPEGISLEEKAEELVAILFSGIETE